MPDRIQDKYVAGFFMDYQMDRFLLIDKGGMKLKDQVLKWQGLGGGIEGPKEAIPVYIREESPHEAMEREFHEESGFLIKKKRWHCFYIKAYKTCKIYYFVAFGDGTELYGIANGFQYRDHPVEGNIEQHSLVDVLFDTSKYTFDIPYLIAMIYREHKAGMLMQLDPEGINTSGKVS